MAGKKISVLPPVTSCQGTDLIPEVQPATNGVTYKATLNQVATFVASTLVTPQNGGIVYTDATSLQVLAPTATANQMLQSGSNSAPHWSTPTYPSASGSAGQVLRSDGTNNVYSTATYADTYAASSILYSNGANTVTGLATANSAALVTNSSGVPAWTASMTNGQVLIGSTGATPVPATITAGLGISIGIGAGSITISSTGGGVGWNQVSGTSQAMSPDSGYINNNAGLTTFTLPTTAAVGTSLSILGDGAGGWTIAQGAGQSIRIGSVTSTVGVGGSVSSTNAGDSLNLICKVADTVWQSSGAPQGNLTIV